MGANLEEDDITRDDVTGLRHVLSDIIVGRCSCKNTDRLVYACVGVAVGYSLFINFFSPFLISSTDANLNCQLKHREERQRCLLMCLVMFHISYTLIELR